MVGHRFATPSRWLKAWAREALRRRGYELKLLATTGETEFSIVELLLERVLKCEPGGAIFQVGANDGVLVDPVRAAIVRHNLPAILIEPLPDIFEDLRKSYADHPKVRCLNVAVSERTGEARLYRIDPAYSDLPEWVRGIASFHRSVLMKHSVWDGVDPKRFEAAIREVVVPVRTFRDLLADVVSPESFIMLQIDTEGHDLVVLRSAANCGFLPPIVTYEHKHLSLADQRSARTLLAKRGYALHNDDCDTIAFRDPERSIPQALAAATG